MKIARHAFCMCLLSLAALGCGGDSEGATGEVEGTVTMDGKPVAEGGIVFYDAQSANSAGGKIENGKFKFADPVKVGEYQVSIQPPEAPQPEDEASAKVARKLAATIPVGYQDASTSGLTAKVAEGPNSFKFELKKRGPPRAAEGEAPP